MTDATRQIGIIVADDHPVVAAGIRAVMEDCPSLRVLAQVGSGHEAIEQCIALLPDVLLLDLRLPDLPGAEVCRRVKTLCPNTRVLILTSYGDDANVMTAMASGADGYLLNLNQAVKGENRGFQVKVLKGIPKQPAGIVIRSESRLQMVREAALEVAAG